MANVLLAWELGGGFGHARPLARLAAALLRRGHAVDLVWKDLSVAGRVLGDLARHPRLRLWQAPIWLPQLAGLSEPATQAELLFRAGYLDPAGLTGLVAAWRNLYERLSPDLVVADHAPTALLATRGLPMRRAVYGNGFTVPPRRTPLPSYREWEVIPAERIEVSDRRLLGVCNEVLAGLGLPPWTAACELYRADDTFLLGWPELDHLAPWRGAATEATVEAATGVAGEATPALRSWGWPAPPEGGAAPLWPSGDGRRIFGYLQWQHPASQAALATLQQGPWRSLIYLGGVSVDDAAALCTPSLRVTTELVDFDRAMADAALVVGSASSGTLYGALSAGVPSVMLPMQAEQMLLARRVVAAGAGVLVWPQEVEAQLARAIAGVLDSPGFAQAARALARRNGAPGVPSLHPSEAQGAAFDADPVTAAIAARCEALATGSAR